MDVCERTGPCLDLIRNHSALDAPCTAAGWVGVVGHRELAGVHGWPWVLQEQSRQVAAGSFAS